jgi:hypothetical protein
MHHTARPQAPSCITEGHVSWMHAIPMTDGAFTSYFSVPRSSLFALTSHTSPHRTLRNPKREQDSRILNRPDVSQHFPRPSFDFPLPPSELLLRYTSERLLDDVETVL